MQALLAPLGELADYQEILKVRKKEDGIIQIAGCVGSQKTHLMYALGDGFEYRVIVFSSEEKAKKAFDEYRIFTDDVYFYPARDLLFYYADIKRVKRGYYHVEVKPLTLHPKELPQYRLTDMYIANLERQIREAPAYWLWSHNRWKRTKQEWLTGSWKWW